MGMLLHVDGARLANAAAALGVPLGALAAGVEADVVSLGATKNGGLVGDAVVFLDPGLGRGASSSSASRAMQLASKMRFLSAQFDALFGESELWRRNAEPRERDGGAPRRRRRRDIDGIELVHPVQANGVFAKLPRPAIDALLATSPASIPSTSGTRTPTWSAGCAPGTRPRATSTLSSPPSERRSPEPPRAEAAVRRLPVK